MLLLCTGDALIWTDLPARAATYLRLLEKETTVATPLEDRGDFAERLDKLFDLIRHPSGREYSLKEIADGTERTGPVTLTSQHLSKLRSGSSRNPGLEQVNAIAAVFGVDPKYFVGRPEDVVRLEAEIELLKNMRARGIDDVLLRASRLTAEGLSILSSTIAGLENVHGMVAKDELPRPKPPGDGSQGPNG